MAIRKPLRNHLTAAWDAVVSADYVRQRINSERSLQASFWSQINIRLPSHFRMFIEPQFTLDDGSRVIPDIVVCNSRSVICVVEIKFRPRGNAAYHKDVRSLNNLAIHGDSLSLSNQRFFGPSVDGRTYGFANHALFVWAGFHRCPNEGTYAKLPSIASDFPALRGHFMQLHAETDSEGPPATFHRLH